MNLRIENLSYQIGDLSVLKKLNLEVQSGELFFLLGASGCGKTTLIRLIAGFIQPHEGDLFLGNRRLNDLPIQQRETALVFQNYALWPHLTVRQNVAFGLEQKKLPSSEVQRRVEEALRQVRLLEVIDRAPSKLSGGQQQRVALARALVVQPQLLMLDEPLSNLDAQLRLEVRKEILNLHRENKTTALYVTHDQEEALSMADRIAIMNQGRIEQIGTPQEIYEKPETPYVATFFGETNEFRGEKSPFARLLGAVAHEKIIFRPEKVRIVSSGSGLPVRIEEIIYRGKESMLITRTSENEIIKIITSDYFKNGAMIDIDLETSSIYRFSIK